MELITPIIRINLFLESMSEIFLSNKPAETLPKDKASFENSNADFQELFCRKSFDAEAAVEFQKVTASPEDLPAHVILPTATP